MKELIYPTVLLILLGWSSPSRAELRHIATISDVTGAHDVVLSGTLALVGCTERYRSDRFYGISNEGLHLVDISEPARPMLLEPSPLPDGRRPSRPFGGVDEIALYPSGAVLSGNLSDNEYHMGRAEFLSGQPAQVEKTCWFATDCFPPAYCKFRTADLAASGTRAIRVEIYHGSDGVTSEDGSLVGLCSTEEDLCNCLGGQIRTEDVHLNGADIYEDLVFLSGQFESDSLTGLHIFQIVGYELVPLSSVETGGSARKVKVIDHYAFVADVDNGLTVVDWFDPYCPRVVGQVDTPAPAFNLYLDEDRNQMVVTMGESGVALIDVEYPSDPVLYDNFDTPGYAQSAAIDGRYVFVADGSGGLVVLRRNSTFRRFDPPSTPAFEPPCDVDVRPGWGDGFTDSHDLLSWMDRIKRDEIDSQNLFVFSRDWRKLTN